jgi:hypothetical protein
MKLLLVLVLAMHGLCLAQVPRVTDAAGKPLRIEQAEIEVRFLADLAETSIELEFRNDTPRALEAEFTLPLPEGATVSAYALDVNGRMRAGVAVEKERARTAYETVKRRMIDPGIVEREAGNIYRTKVYPVPANGTKRLRISYIETLRSGDGGLLYSLPLDFPEPLARLSCHLYGKDLRVTGDAGFRFADDGFGCLRAEGKSAKGLLKVSLNPPDDDLLVIENEGQPAFYLRTTVPDSAPRERPAPRTVLLVWDASASGRERDHSREFALLDAWFATLGATKVKLRLLRDQIVDGGEFDVREGRWQDLKQQLEQIDYDGATDFTHLRAARSDADLMVVVSDGVSTLGSGIPPIEVPWELVKSGSHPPGVPMDTPVIDPAADGALAKLTHQSLRLIAVVGDDLEDHRTDGNPAPGMPLRISGTLKHARAGTLELRYGFGNQVTATRTVRYQPGGNPGGIVRRLHAQRVLADLERQAKPDREAIIGHCKRHGLVSDFTSLIVLERLEDYAEHGITPPEPELRAAYDELVAKRESSEAKSLGGLRWAWEAKLAWYAKRFPGYEARILPRLRQIGIWKNAVEKQFPPERRDPAAFGTVAGWFEKAMELIEAKAKLRSKQEYAAWCERIDALHAEGPELTETPLHPPPPGQPLAVSVRGLVAEPGVISADPTLTLRQAIEKAGGRHPSGSLAHVALYRNGGKVVYNTLSEDYQDVPLFPADMIVVESGGRDYEYLVDPFSAPQPTPDPRKDAPVRKQTDVWVRTAEAMGAADGIAARPLEGNSDAIRTVAVETTDANLPDSTALEKALAAGTEPETAWRNHRGDAVWPQRFYIESARVLFAAKHDTTATRVLSNLVEQRPDDPAALRAFAFWLAEFGRFEQAETVLESIREDAVIDLLADLDLVSLRNQRDDAAAAFSGWTAALEDVAATHSGNLGAIALSELNALHRRAGDAGASSPEIWYGAPFETHLPADLRIVLTAADPTDRLRFEIIEPDGFRCSTATSPSPSGGRIIGADGVREYMIRRAVPGIHRIACSSDGPVTVRAAIHTNWGRPDQKSKVVTLLLDSDKLHEIAEVEFEFAPGNE